MAGSVFHAYDIRGKYKEELTEDLAYKIGFFTVKSLNFKTVVVGQDKRTHSESLFKSLVSGIIDAGADVIDIGLCTTPMFYFASNKIDSDGGVMVTASHNPKEYNGFKIVREKGYPVSFDTGLDKIKEKIDDPIIKNRIGKITKKSIINEYIDFLVSAGKCKKFKVAVDTGNGMSGLTDTEILRKLGCEVYPMYEEIDMTFPNHVANPLIKENVLSLVNTVKSQKFDLGIAFDGDGDRVMFVDSSGKIVSSDIVGAVIARHYLKQNKHSLILYDLRSSKIVPKTIEEFGGRGLMTRVGHSYIKETMRKKNALFASELSGHYYYKDFFYCDSGIYTAVLMLNILTEEGKTLAEITGSFDKYFKTEEINFSVTDKEKVLQRVKDAFSSYRQLDIDGLSVYGEDFWFNVRMSNTEPLLRLNLEADTKKRMIELKKKLDCLIST